MDVKSFNRDGVEIAYIDETPDNASGNTILLIHGFASNMQTNWIDTGWVRALLREGFRVVACDVRGHGQSEKLYDETRYGAQIFARDAAGLLDYLDIEQADVMGYSMGARVSAFLAMEHPSRVRSAIFGGLGSNMVIGLPGARAIAHAFLADSIDDVTHPTAQSFRLFAESTRSDLKALAHCILSARAKITEDMIAAIRVPVLVAVGTEDPIGGSAKGLSDLIPGAKSLDLEGYDHMKAVGARPYKDGVIAFLKTLSD